MYGTKAGNLDFVDGVDSFVQTAKAHKNLQESTDEVGLTI